MSLVAFTVRQATPADADAIAKVHIDSIRTLGAKYYTDEVIAAWGAHREGDLYRQAMKNGEIFFLAVGSDQEAESMIGGFSSYRFAENSHRIAVYVHEKVARKGVGTALLQAAEEAALRHGCCEIKVDASLAAFDFYQKNGFELVRHGKHALNTGTIMGCVFMCKPLVPAETIPCLSS